MIECVIKFYIFISLKGNSVWESIGRKEIIEKGNEWV